ncbi:DNA primase [hydrothermal vent metagenome]|uniref:DNA primase n=1 Tax=hydrothermal vent metagenome TaxID=652676 RepID=A0A3B1BVH8_9ZZZZ
MAGRIPRAFIDDLLNRVDIVELINKRLPLKKGGKDYQACCPFHDEKTPSFTVSRNKQFYHCFGCGANGSAIGFLMEYDNMSFVDAIEDLAHQAGIEIPREQGGHSSGPDCRPLYATLEQAAQFYVEQLRIHPQAHHAVDYLKQRGLSGEIAQAFSIGFAPPGWDNLIQHQGQDQQGMRQLKETGMTLDSDGRCYDRFRDRIMFPIRDYRGRTIAFGGRVLDDTKPKYLNSPETPVFHKGRELYGLHEAHKALRNIERLLVVEGYMDVVALAQFGIRYAVATLGTATTPEHLERLFRTTPEVIFSFDGDRAGRDAGWKALNTALPLMREGRNARFLFLPDGEDPDTLVRKEGTAAFEQRIQNATPLSNFMFDKLAEQTDMESLDGRARLAELAKPLIAKLPEGIFREMMLNQLSELVGLAPARLATRNPPAAKQGSLKAKQRDLQPKSLVQQAVALLLQYPEVAQVLDLPTDWQGLDAPGIDLLSELLTTIQANPTISRGALFEHWRDRKEGRYLSKLATLELHTEGHTAEFQDTIVRLRSQFRKQEMEQLLEKARQTTITSDDKQHLNQLFKEQAANDTKGSTDLE